jgi:radical SAM superfamily enzyme YgiQ (UPF0313 family)
LRAFQAPLGLRRIESVLLANGFSAHEVAVVPPEKLAHAVGPDTRIIALSSGDPLGRGMNTNTMTAIAGGRSWTEVLFRRLVAQARLLKDSFPSIRIVAGGPGAWQLAQANAMQLALGIDHVFAGYCEADIAAYFHRLAAGEELPSLINCSWKSSDAIAPIAGATVMGLAEISRGCGLGCDFCTIADVQMTHLSQELIAQDLATNVGAGVRDVGLISEDFLRYGGTIGKTNPLALIASLPRFTRSFPPKRAAVTCGSISESRRRPVGCLPPALHALRCTPFTRRTGAKRAVIRSCVSFGPGSRRWPVS